MDLYTLDSSTHYRVTVTDVYNSLIWTERWQSYGEFELEIVASPQNKGRFSVGTWVSINESFRVMIVDSTEETYQDGEAVLHVKGKSLESILLDRVVKESNNSGSEEPWSFSGTPTQLANKMFDHICRDGALHPDDVLPNLMPGSLYVPGTIEQTHDSLTWAQKPDILYNAIRDVCERFNLGFRLVSAKNDSKLYFDVYQGNDRTSRQNVLVPVVFDVKLDDYFVTSDFRSVENHKNVAYVHIDEHEYILNDQSIPFGASGFDRRVMLVDGVLSDGQSVQSALISSGRTALAKHKRIRLVDGMFRMPIAYKYDSYYLLGDIVEFRYSNGDSENKRVTEQIFVSDAEGYRSYPTLSAETVDLPS